MTTTHEQINITKHDDHYRATIYVGNRLSMFAEGDTEQSARLSLLDRLLTEDDDDITLSGPIVQELKTHANNHARLHMVRSVREAWSAIRHTDWAKWVDRYSGFSAIETAAQIVHGGVDVDCAFIDKWPTLACILRSVRDAYQLQMVNGDKECELIDVVNRLDRMLLGTNR